LLHSVNKALVCPRTGQRLQANIYHNISEVMSENKIVTNEDLETFRQDG